jgi:alpha-glucosidase
MVRAEAPLETVPMFVRGGAIIPTGPAMNHVGEKPVDPITFAIYPDEKGAAATTLYEDDGTSPGYLQGALRRTAVTVKRTANGYAVNLSAPQGSYNPGARKFIFAIRPVAKLRPITVTDDGTARTVVIK